MAKKLRMAVVGVGHFGRFHAEKVAGLERAELVGLADIAPSRVAELGARLAVKAVTDYRELLGEVDAVSVAVPTTAHYEVAKAFLESGVHVLVEKPITDGLEAASELIDLARRRGLVLQVGHLERFSAAAAALERRIPRPLYIDSQRVAPFRPRGTDVNVILDVMIHDIDLILTLVRAPILSIDAVGAPVLSSLEDIANARIRFANGCVASITASRVSTKTERKMRIFQPDSYVVLDFGSRRVSVMRKGAGPVDPTFGNITVEQEEYQERDELKREIEAFVTAVLERAPPLVSGEDGRRALEAAIRINESLRSHRAFVQRAAGEIAGADPAPASPRERREIPLQGMEQGR